MSAFSELFANYWITDVVRGVVEVDWMVALLVKWHHYRVAMWIAGVVLTAAVIHL